MGGFWRRLTLACAAFFTILFKGRLPEALQRTPAASKTTAAETPPVAIEHAALDADRAIQMIALLQRDGRLVDFLMEDLSPYSDAQIGAAVRDVHDNCRRALQKYVALEAIVDGREGDEATVGEVDPSTIRLLGNVAGQPPFRGRLLHRGWRVARVELPPLGPPASRRVVAQAEIELA